MPPAGVGRHYSGTRAADYLDYQRPMGELAAGLDRWKFEPYARPDAVVVDFGCGTGALLARLPARERIGVEPSAPARTEAEARGLRVVATAGELPDAVADVVITNHALEHALAPLDELRELHRLLRSGGLLVAYTPIDDWRAQRRAAAPDPNHHLYTWTPLLMGNLLDEAGFDVRECRVVTRAWPPRAELLSRLPGPLPGLAGRAWSVLRRRRQVAAVARRP